MWQRPLAILFAILLSLLALLSPASATQRTDPDNQMLFDLRVGSQPVGNGVRAYTTSAGLCLDFQDVVDSLQLVVKRSADGKRAEGWAFQQSNMIAIDQNEGTVHFGDKSEKLSDAAIWESASGWCVIVSDLSRWLGVSFEPDMANAILSVKAETMLPIEAAQKRADDAERLNGAPVSKRPDLPRRALPYRVWRMPALDIGMNALAERKPNSAMRLARDYEVLAAGELAWLSAEGRLASDKRGLPQSFRLKLYREDSYGRMLGPIGATSFAIGDVTSNASILTTVSTPGRGAFLSNRPLDASDRPDQVDFIGVSPRGWDTELYHNNELIRTVTANDTGRYEFRDVKLQVGLNDFEIVQYGPQGQVRRERRAFQMDAQTPGRNATWWGLSLVDGRRDVFTFDHAAKNTQFPSAWRFDATLDHGFGRGLSVAIGVHDFSLPETGRTHIGEVTGSASLFGTFLQMGMARDSSGSAAYRARALGRVLGVNFTLEDIRNRGLASERLDSDQRAVTQLSLDKSLRLGANILPIHFDLKSIVTTRERTLQSQMRLALTTRRLAVAAVIGVQRIAPLDGTVRCEKTLGLLFNGRIGQVRMRGETQWVVASALRLNAASTTANIPVGERDMMNATLGYSGGDKDVYGQIDYSRDLGFASVNVSAQLSRQGAASIGLGMRFSFGPNGQGRFGHFSAVPRAATGQMNVRVYRDINGNGQRDAQEPFVRSPGLVLNDVPISPNRETDPPDGSQRLEGLAPSIPVRLALDQGAISDPFDIASVPGFAVIPRAGLVTSVELGITSTVTIEGSLRIDNRQAAGEALELVGSDGKVSYQMHTDFDGFFSIERVRYGQYHLRLARNGREVLASTIKATSEHATIRLGELSFYSVLQISSAR